MYRIDKAHNTIEPLKKCTFSELRLRERAHLQEWLAKHPSALGEELLIIQKEFAGFSDTQERLDLLALDKEGSLVIIENKLDDTGRDVTWQALKYASYCAGLSKEDIRKVFQEYLDRTKPDARAEELLSEFFKAEDFQELTLNKSVTQRIMLVAANFRKEVTSTVLWLSNFKIRIQCFKATPFSMGEELFLNIEQMIPTKDTEEFMIGLADKARDEIEGVEEQKHRHVVRKAFWGKALQAMSEKSGLYRNVSPGTDSWIWGSTGVTDIGLNLGATKSHARAELYIDRGDRSENKRIFDALYSQRDAIEGEFGGKLIWMRLDDKQASRVKAETDGNIFDQEQWDAMIAFMTDAMVRLEKCMKPRLRSVLER